MLPFVLYLLLSANDWSGALFAAEAGESCAPLRLDLTDPVISRIPIQNQHPEDPSCAVYSATFLDQVWTSRMSGNEPGYLAPAEDPELNYQRILKSPSFTEIFNADRGRTCQSAKWIAEQRGENSPQHFPRCEMFGLQKTKVGQVLHSPSEFRSEMDSLLDRASPSPFALEFCAGVLYGNSDMITKRSFDASLEYLNTDRQFENFSPGCFFHVAVVVGRAVRNGKCRYLIRDSLDHAQARSHENEENGHIWIDADSLSANTLRLIHLE